jgi:hypothetical protein
MKKTIIIGLSSVLGLALVATLALAWGPGFGPRLVPLGFGGSGFGVPPIPNLTADQSAQIQALRDGFLKEIEPLQEDLYAKGHGLRPSSYGLRSSRDGFKGSLVTSNAGRRFFRRAIVAK